MVLIEVSLSQSTTVNDKKTTTTITSLTHTCSRYEHDNPIDDLCRYYPWSGDMGMAPLLLNCDYQVNFFIYYFDNFFKKESSKGDVYE